MREMTVRISEGTWRKLKAAAEQDGVPAAQLVREATIEFLAAEAERRDRDEIRAEVAGIARRLEAVERALTRRAR